MLANMDFRFSIGNRFYSPVDYRIDCGIGEGYFARVFKSYDIEEDQWVAFKVMRSKYYDQNGDEEILTPPNEKHYDAFIREVEFLVSIKNLLNGHTGIARIPNLYTVGYLKDLDEDSPSGDLLEEVSIEEFIAKDQWKDRMKDGWLAYIAMEVFPKSNRGDQIANFYKQLNRKLDNDLDKPHLPLLHALLFGLQLSKLYEIIHGQEDTIYYPDSKLPHCFWDGTNAVLIDWNRVWKESERANIPEVQMTKHEDIRHLLAVPLFGLLTGEEIGGIQPWISSQPNEDKIMKRITKGFNLLPESLIQLYEDTIQKDIISTATALSIRIEEILIELYDYDPEDIENSGEKFHKTIEILNNMQEVDRLISSIWKDARYLNLDLQIADTEYLQSLIGYIRECKITPWINAE